MSSTIFSLSGQSLNQFWTEENARQTETDHTLIHANLVWSPGDNLHVNWQGWAVVEQDGGFYASLTIYRIPAVFAQQDMGPRIQRFQFDEWEGPHFYAIPEDLFKSLIDLPMPPTWHTARVERAIRWRAKVQEFIDQGIDRVRV